MNAHQIKKITEPRISIVLNTYNQEKYIRQCLDSLLDQTLMPHEIIIGDDCSTDRNWDIIQEYAAKHPNLIRAFRRETNVGAMRNAAMSYAVVTGNLVSLIDGDDWWLPRKLELEWKALENNPDAHIAYSNAVITDEAGNPKRLYRQEHEPTPPSGDVFIQVFAKRFFASLRAVFRNELVYVDALKAVGHIDENAGLYVDWDMKVRLTSAFKVAYSGETQVFYRTNDAGISRQNHDKHVDSLLYIVNKNLPLLEKTSRQAAEFVVREIESVISNHYPGGQFRFEQFEQDENSYQKEIQDSTHNGNGTHKKVQINSPQKLESNYSSEKISETGKNLILEISQPRAGSTLLQRIIGAHSQVHTTAEPWLMLHPLFALKQNGLEVVYNAKQGKNAMMDFCATLPGGYTTWVESIRKMTSHLYNAALQGKPESRFLDKTPRYYFVINELRRVLPDAHYVFIIRNPLAVLSSIFDTWLEKEEWWKTGSIHRFRYDLFVAPQLMLDAIEAMGNKAIRIQYETLVQYPEETVNDLCNKLDLPFENEMIEYGNKNRSMGRFGDQRSVNKHSKPTAEYLDRWTQKLVDPRRHMVAQAYLGTLGENLIARMGYNYTELQQKLKDVTIKRNLQQPEIDQLIAILNRMVVDIEDVTTPLPQTTGKVTV